MAISILPGLIRRLLRLKANIWSKGREITAVISTVKITNKTITRDRIGIINTKTIIKGNVNITNSNTRISNTTTNVVTTTEEEAVAAGVNAVTNAGVNAEGDLMVATIPLITITDSKEEIS